MQEKTSYGIKEKGSSKFIIVAPHSGKVFSPFLAQDDKNTGRLAQDITSQLKAFLVVNEKYIKPKTGRMKDGFDPGILKDFNKLTYIKKENKYVWNDKELKDIRMKEFYYDTLDFIKTVHDKYSKKAVVVFIHGMRDGDIKKGDDDTEIDIGCGAKYYNGRLMSAKEGHPEAYTNTGDRKMELKDITALKAEFQKQRLKVGVGDAIRINKETGKPASFTAWSRRNGVQFIKEPDYSFQLEIAWKLRKNKLENTSKIIVGALKSVYS